MGDQEFQSQVIDRLARIEERAANAAIDLVSHRGEVVKMQNQIEEMHAKLEGVKPIVTIAGFLQFLGAIILAAAGAAGVWVWGLATKIGN